MWKKIVLAVLLLVVAVASWFAYRIGPRNIIGLMRYDQRHEGTLKVGDLAPDVLVTPLASKEKVPLASFMGKKPLVLIFGSFT